MDDFVIGISTFLIGCIIGASVMATALERGWQENAIEAGHAQYDKTTGQWKWK